MKYRHEIFLVPFKKSAFAYRVTHLRTMLIAEEFLYAELPRLENFRDIRKHLIGDIKFRLSA